MTMERSHAGRPHTRPCIQSIALFILVCSVLFLMTEVGYAQTPTLKACFTLDQNWGTGFQGQFNVTNSGSTPIRNWRFEFDLGQNISSLWNATLQSHTGNHYVVVAPSWAPDIAPGGTANIGFNASIVGTLSPPTNFLLNGVSISCGSVGNVVINPPTNLSASNITANSVTLMWTASSTPGVTYAIFNGATPVGTTANTFFTVTGLASGVTFTFMVTAQDSSNHTSTAASLRATTLGTPVTIQPPTNLRATNVTQNSLTLSWTASTTSGVTYTVSNGGSAVGTTTGTSLAVTGLAAGTSFTFSVVASDAAGNMSNSAMVTVSTLAAPPPPPNNCNAPPWTSSGVFVGGDKAVFRNYLWQAKWWTQNDTPTPSDGGPWLIVGFCGQTPGPASGRMFAPYVDVTMGFNLTQNAAKTGGHYTLAFITDGGGCTAKWAGTTALSSNLYMADIATLRAQGGDVVISFGGAAGNELGSTCPSVGALQAQYQAVISQYQLKRIDLDIEGGALSNFQMRNTAVANLQRANPGLKVSYTLPVLPTGLLANGLAVVRDAINQGVTITQVNVMAMDFGTAFDNNGQMGLSAIRSAWSTMAQLESLLPNLSHAQIANMVGVTVMIGQNDNPAEVFRLSDIPQWLIDARANGVGLLSFWSATRDRPCPGGILGPPALGECSGVAQNPLDYSVGFAPFTR